MRRLLLAVMLLGARASRAGPIVVVAPEPPSAPYAEALKGVCDGLGACPTVLGAEGDLPLPPETRVVIALGGRAARLRFPAGVVLVTALSPGYDARPRRAEGPVVRVRLTLSPEDFARRLASLSPQARRAALLWSEPASGRFAEAVRATAGALGIAISPVQVADPDSLPALLRGLPPADVLFLAPDPQLVTPSTFDAAREFARSRGLAFFAPAPGLAARGGLSGLAPDFRAAGLRAAAAANDALAGRDSPEEAYPDAEALRPAAPLIVSTKTLSEQQRSSEAPR